MPTPFFGRDRELATLQRLFTEAATRGPDGAFGGPRLAVVTAETGYGKSRLVQELYLRLTTDPTWDPPEVDYWPPAFGDIGAQLRVSPDMQGHVAKGAPRFLWLGARWQPIEQRNVDTRCALPDLRSEFGVHLAVIERSKSAWARAFDATKRAVRKDGVAELFSQAADQAMPLGGLALRWLKAGKDLLGDGSARDRGHDGARAEQAQDIVDELMECFTDALHGRAALPVVVWLDDAQWMDRETLRWLQRLWREASTKRWPVLVVVTHWEREWRQLRKLPPAERDATLAAFEGRPGVEVVELPPAGDEALAGYLRSQLPGLLPAQARLLLDKAAGNFLTMVENVGDLRNEPMNFVDGEVEKALAPEGEDRVRTWESERDKRVEQRFKTLEPKVRNLLGWSSQLGVRFLHTVVADFATRMAGVPEAPAMLEWCVDPGVILGSPSKRLREFRDRAFHFVAQKHFVAYGQRHAAQLTSALREHLIGWIERSFGDDGQLLGLADDRPAAPDDSAVALALAGETAEMLDLLDMAIRQFAITDSPNWGGIHDRTALRARCLAIFCSARANSWSRVRVIANEIIDVRWDDVPISVLADEALSILSDAFVASSCIHVAKQIESRRLRVLKARGDANCDLKKLWEVTMAMGHIEHALGNVLLARDYFRAACDINGQDQGEAAALSSARVIIADMYSIDMNLALGDDLTDCLYDYKKLEDKTLALIGTNAVRDNILLRVAILRRTAIAHIKIGHDHDALECLQEALAFLDDRLACDSSADVAVVKATICEQITDVHTAAGRALEASHSAQSALGLRRNLDDLCGSLASRRSLAGALERTGVALLALGNSIDSGKCLEECLQMRRDIVDSSDALDDKRYLAAAMTYCGDLSQDSGDAANAIRCYNEAAEVLVKCVSGSSHRDVRNVALVCARLGSAHAVLGNNVDSYVFARRAYILRCALTSDAYLETENAIEWHDDHEDSSHEWGDDELVCDGESPDQHGISLECVWQISVADPQQKIELRRIRGGGTPVDGGLYDEARNQMIEAAMANGYYSLALEMMWNRYNRLRSLNNEDAVEDDESADPEALASQLHSVLEIAMHSLVAGDQSFQSAFLEALNLSKSLLIWHAVAVFDDVEIAGRCALAFRSAAIVWQGVGRDSAILRSHRVTEQILALVYQGNGGVVDVEGGGAFTIGDQDWKFPSGFGSVEVSLEENIQFGRLLGVLKGGISIARAHFAAGDPEACLAILSIVNVLIMLRGRWQGGRGGPAGEAGACVGDVIPVAREFLEMKYLAAVQAGDNAAALASKQAMNRIEGAM